MVGLRTEVAFEALCTRGLLKSGLRPPSDSGVLNAPMPKSADAAEPSLEEAMTRISGLVETMESGDLPLEKLIASYEEGIALVKSCQDKLDAAARRIEKISRDTKGRLSVDSFEEVGQE